MGRVKTDVRADELFCNRQQAGISRYTMNEWIVNQDAVMKALGPQVLMLFIQPVDVIFQFLSQGGVNRVANDDVAILVKGLKQVSGYRHGWVLRSVVACYDTGATCVARSIFRFSVF